MLRANRAVRAARGRSVALVLALALVALVGRSGEAFAAVRADYRFAGTYESSEGGPDLTPLGDVPNAFVTETVNGAPRQVLAFACNSGVQGGTAGVIDPAEYSVAVLFRFANLSGYNRILDFNGGVGDDGLYVLGGALNFFPVVTASGTQFAPNTYAQVVLTRTAAGEVTGYVNGTQAITFDDAAEERAVIKEDLLRWFRDNDGGGGPTTEASAGAVARIRLFDEVLTSEQVAALDDTPPTAPEEAPPGDDCDQTPPEPEPEPGPSPSPSPSPSVSPSPSPSVSPSPSASPSPRPGDPGVVRTGGDVPAEPGPLAVNICFLVVPEADGARAVLLARDDQFADALAGAPLAGDDACIVYTPGGPDQPLSDDARAEIDRALAEGGLVHILGGTNAVSQSAEDELDTAGYQVDRIAGESRFQTAVSIAERVVAGRQPAEVMVAFAFDWPDAVTGGAYGAEAGVPVLLTDPNDLHPASRAFLDAHPSVVTTTILGGTTVIEAGVEGHVPGARRVAGGNRMGTAAAVADQLWRPLDPDGTLDRFTVVNLGNFGDASQYQAWTVSLAAAPLAAALDSPQLGVFVDGYPPETASFLRAQGFRDLPSITLVGGLSVIGAEVADQIEDDVDPG